MAFFDRDTNWRSPASIQHLVFLGFGLCWVLGLFLPLAVAFGMTVVVGFFWELAQWDTCRYIPSCHEGGQLDRPFLPGYGFGLMDLGLDTLGALVAVGLRLV